ncbi:tubulin epsilon and delta complex protein 1 isoform X3 [Monodon monoceros]|uniref:tubulin epsilon and delta complex protein 1 isoform X3 n=1 Tax=Monodon monoceros TaxID=40151 RepID=UPI0010F7F733|nr:tubulin epsilon and delta complex protein 1 isoform X3 [Monodon monoceros]
MGRRRRRRRVDPADATRALPEAIAALSQTLPAGPSPETFRRAKFDRPEAAPALWRLLFRVLSPQLADGASASFSPEAQVRSVKLALRTQGYPRRALAQLPDDGSQGGRELLLALAWLLARGPLPERLLTQNRVQLGDEMPVCECEALASPGPPTPSVEADGCVDIRHLQWLMGKLRFRWRNLMASQQEQCALLGKIHSYTRGCHSDRSLGHLSVTETELLRDPEGGRQLLRRLERENARLQAALEWRRRELVFWWWMDPHARDWSVGAPGAGAAGPAGRAARGGGGPAGGLGGRGEDLGPWPGLCSVGGSHGGTCTIWSVCKGGGLTCQTRLPPHPGHPDGGLFVIPGQFWCRPCWLPLTPCGLLDLLVDMCVPQPHLGATLLSP